MITKILTPTDGSETAKAAVQYAKDIALAEHAQVEVLGVVHSIQYGDSTVIDPTPELKPDFQQYVQSEVDELKAAGVDAFGKTVSGYQVDRTIAETVDEDGADLVVMGTHGHTGLARSILGSVADRVVRETKVPVLLIPKR